MRSFHFILSLGTMSLVPHLARALRVVEGRAARPTMRPLYRCLSRNKDKDKDYIDVEIIDNTKSRKNNKENITREMPASDVDSTSSGLLGLAKRTAQSAVQGLSKLFGRDEESIKRKERTAVLNQQIDTMFQNTGIMGSIVGRFAKKIGAIAMDRMAEEAKVIGDIHDQVEDLLQDDAECRSALGSAFDLFPPISTSSSEMNINGRTEKRVVLVMPVQGSRGVGQVQVRASSDGTTQGLVLDEVILQLSSGRVIRVPTGGGRGRAPGRGKIIDV